MTRLIAATPDGRINPATELQQVKSSLMDLNAIRQDSIARARRLGVHVPETLPRTEPENLRATDEIVDRALALSCTVSHSYGFPAASSLAWLEREGLLGSLSPSERRYLEKGEGLTEAFQGQVESLWVLTWAVQRSDSLAFDVPCPDDLVHRFPNLKTGEKSATFRANASVRPVEDIVRNADLAYCLHWALVQARLEGRAPPGNVAPHIIVNRRRALDWVISPHSWDEVPLDT